jgi:hypothetical protein
MLEALFHIAVKAIFCGWRVIISVWHLAIDMMNDERLRNNLFFREDGMTYGQVPVRPGGEVLWQRVGIVVL